MEKDLELETLRDQLKTALESAEKWKSFSRKHEQEKSELKDKLSTNIKETEEFKALEKELETSNNLNTEMTSKLQSIEKNNRLEGIKAEFNLPDTAIKFLSGETEEELKASAKDLSEMLNIKPSNSKDNSNDDSNEDNDNLKDDDSNDVDFFAEFNNPLQASDDDDDFDDDEGLSDFENL